MHGVAPDTEIASFNVFGDTDYSVNEMLADAYDRLIEADATAVNLSLGYLDAYDNPYLASEGTWTQEEVANIFDEYIDAAYRADAADMISVWAAGNYYGDDPALSAALPYYFPELEDTWLSVVAVDQWNEIADFSNTCGITADWCISAPGTSIYSTIPDEGYAYASGTSMAAPIVTGSIALLKSEFPELTGVEIVDILKTTATDLGEEGVDEIYGNGLLNLEDAMAPVGDLTIASTDSIYGESYAAQSSTISGSGPVLNAIKSAFNDLTISMNDDFGRSYQMSAGIAVASLGGSVSTSALSATYADGGRMDSYSTLSGGEYSIPFDTVGLEISFSNIHAEDKSFEVAYASDTGFGAMRLGAGYVSEKDGFLGTQLSGAFAADTQTMYIDADWDFELSKTDMISAGFEYGMSDLQGNGVIRKGNNITSSSFSVDYRTNIGKGQLSIGMASLLDIDKGSLSLDIPVGVAAASSESRGTTVERVNADVDLDDGGSEYLLNIGYTAPIGGVKFDADWGVGATLNTQRPQEDTSLSTSFRIVF